jgi:hypothetical protein
MKDIPSDILEQFRNMLKKRLIPVGLYSYYLKWLRYYMDYCSKYHLPETSSKSLQQFLQKLLEKKQTEEQRGQAEMFWGHHIYLLTAQESKKDFGQRRNLISKANINYAHFTCKSL